MSDKKVQKLVVSALMAALTYVATTVVRIPAPTGGYVHMGDGLVLLCALAFSGHIMVIDHFSPKVDGVQMSCIQFFVASLFSMVCMLGAEGVPTAGDVFQSWAPILYAGILSSGVGYTLQIVGQKGVNPTIASLILSLESVMSVLAGWLFLHQGMSGGRTLHGCNCHIMRNQKSGKIPVIFSDI